MAYWDFWLHQAQATNDLRQALPILAARQALADLDQSSIDSPQIGFKLCGRDELDVLVGEVESGFQVRQQIEQLVA